MNTAELSRARWRKSSYSANDNACVEVAHLDPSLPLADLDARLIG
jgi:Domain of unknown function (DUF397)